MKLNGFWRPQLVTCWIFSSCRLFVTVNKMENTINSISQLQQQIYGTEIPALQYIQQIFKVCICWPSCQFLTIHVINENKTPIPVTYVLSLFLGKRCFFRRNFESGWPGFDVHILLSYYICIELQSRHQIYWFCNSLRMDESGKCSANYDPWKLNPKWYYDSIYCYWQLLSLITKYHRC